MYLAGKLSNRVGSVSVRQAFNIEGKRIIGTHKVAVQNPVELLNRYLGSVIFHFPVDRIKQVIIELFSGAIALDFSSAQHRVVAKLVVIAKIPLMLTFVKDSFGLQHLIDGHLSVGGSVTGVGLISLGAH